MLKITEKGRYYELPIVGLKIKSINYNGRIQVVFSDEEGSSLDIDKAFKLTQYNQSKEFSSSSKDALISFYDLFSVTIVEATADNSGNLFLVFENHVEVTIEDGPYENWHYTKRNPSKGFLFVHGGVGRTVIVEG